jgi:hypothetical protein
MPGRALKLNTRKDISLQNDYFWRNASMQLLDGKQQCGGMFQNIIKFLDFQKA